MNRKVKTQVDLSDVQRLLLTKKAAFVTYRLPNKSNIFTQIQYKSSPTEVQLSSFDFSKSGFIISTFEQGQDAKTWFLQPDVIVEGNQIRQELVSQIKALQAHKHSYQTEEQSTSKAEFIENVERAKKQIATGELRKVVLSKIKIISKDNDFDIADFFHSLCSHYPHALVYLFHLPGVACWIGATPEPLLEIGIDKAKTISLAGTQAVDGQKGIDEYRWGAKELEEQAIVTEFIGNTLQAKGMKNILKNKTESHFAANLVHLKTEFQFDLPHISQIGELLESLQPTPSVGGFPKEMAKQFIVQNENHQRAYYSGILGSLNIHKKTNIFVNLRCLQVFDKEIILYSGAGITASSDAESEWVETENKMKTMLNVLRELNSFEKKI